RPPPPDPPRPGDSGRLRQRWAVGSFALLLLAVFAATAWWATRQRPHAGPLDAVVAGSGATVPVKDALLVLPTRVEDGDDVAWVRLGLMDYLGDRLRRS